MSDDRDARRPRSPPRGVGLTEPPELVTDEVTGQHEGEELQDMRRRRSTGERVDKLEIKVDGLFETRIEHGEALARIDAKLEALPRLEHAIDKLNDRRDARDDVTFTAQLDVHKAGTIAKIEDKTDSRKARRWLAAKVIAGVVSVGVSSELVHWIAGKL